MSMRETSSESMARVCQRVTRPPQQGGQDQGGQQYKEAGPQTEAFPHKLKPDLHGAILMGLHNILGIFFRQKRLQVLAR